MVQSIIVGPGGWGVQYTVLFTHKFSEQSIKNQVSCNDIWTNRLCAIITARIIAENYSPPLLLRLLLIPLSRKGSDIVDCPSCCPSSVSTESTEVGDQHDDALLLQIRLNSHVVMDSQCECIFSWGFLNMIYLHFYKSKTNGTQVSRG